MQRAADWYPDPDNSKQLRYWDGEAWTEQRKPVKGFAAEFLIVVIFFFILCAAAGLAILLFIIFPFFGLTLRESAALLGPVGLAALTVAIAWLAHQKSLKLASLVWLLALFTVAPLIIPQPQIALLEIKKPNSDNPPGASDAVKAATQRRSLAFMYDQERKFNQQKINIGFGQIRLTKERKPRVFAGPGERSYHSIYTGFLPPFYHQKKLKEPQKARSLNQSVYRLREYEAVYRLRGYQWGINQSGWTWAFFLINGLIIATVWFRRRDKAQKVIKNNQPL